MKNKLRNLLPFFLSVILFSCVVAEKGNYCRKIIKYYPTENNEEVDLYLYTDKGDSKKTIKYDSIYIYVDSVFRIFTGIEDGFSIKHSVLPKDSTIILKTDKWSYSGHWKGF